MKSSLFLMLSFLVVATSVKAWKEVGNAAGLSEQNVIYALQNSQEIFSRTGSVGGFESDYDFLGEFEKDLHQAQLEFSYIENAPRAFEVQGNRWILYSHNLLKYDLDQDEVLSLQESYGLLLDIFAAKKGYNKNDVVSEKFRQFRTDFVNALASAEKTLIFRTFNEVLQWTEFSGSYFLFFAETEALQLTPELLAPRLCQGSMTNLRLPDPSLTSAQRRDTSIRLLVTVMAYFECNGKPASRKLLLDLVATPKDGTLVLH